MQTPDYPYAEGAAFERDKRYSYSKYHGMAFFNAWRSQRRATLKQLPIGRASPPNGRSNLPGGTPIDTAELLDFLYGSLALDRPPDPMTYELVDQLVRRFEVFRRIHAAFDERFCAVDKKNFENLELYIRAAEVFEAAYEATESLTYLNVLLKIIDSLCANAKNLSRTQSGRLVNVIYREDVHIAHLLDSLGISDD